MLCYPAMLKKLLTCMAILQCSKNYLRALCSQTVLLCYGRVRDPVLIYWLYSIYTIDCDCTRPPRVFVVSLTPGYVYSSDRTYWGDGVGYHMYQDIWNAALGEQITCQREPSNHQDPFAMAVMRFRLFVGHENCCELNFHSSRPICKNRENYAPRKYGAIR